MSSAFVTAQELRTLRLQIDGLLRDAGITAPPVPVEQLAKIQGVREVRLESLEEVDAELVPVGDGFIIRVNDQAPPARQRFSVAHEVAHTFFPHRRTTVKRRRVRRASLEAWGFLKEEKLCDAAAAEMLMPRTLFFREADGKPPSVDLIQQLAQTFETSIQSTAKRYADLYASRAQIVRWTKSKKGLRAESVDGQKVFDIPRMLVLEPRSYIGRNVHAAYQTRETARDFSLVEEIYPPERIWIESRAFGTGDQRYVLTILRSARVG